MMRGTFLHNEVLIQPLDLAFCFIGALTFREWYVNDCETKGYVDLWVEMNGFRIAVEAELTSKRVAHDLRKARALHADELWIVVPTVRVARAVHRKLNTLASTGMGPEVFFLTQGQALQRVTICLPLFAGS